MFRLTLPWFTKSEWSALPRRRRDGRPLSREIHPERFCSAGRSVSPARKTQRASMLADDLRAARDLVSAGWTQGVAAKDASGIPANSLAPGAVRFCILGALRRTIGDDVINEPRHRAAYLALADELRRLGLNDDRVTVDARALHRFNDQPSTTQEIVVQLFDKAIARAEASP
jgi:hypothetical protein